MSFNINNDTSLIGHKKSRKEKDKEEYLRRMKEKRKQKKQNRKINKAEKKKMEIKNEVQEQSTNEEGINLNDFEIEYVEDKANDKIIESADMQKIFDHFKFPEPKKNEKEDIKKKEEKSNDIYDELDNEDKKEKEAEKKISKKKLKKMNRIKLTDLKQLTAYPEIVEAWDITAQDPKLLIFLKSLKNTVPVPKHWAQKNKYLQSQRGVLRERFKLPDYIEATGISKVRNVNNKETILKLKMRQRMSPKLGRQDIDYQVLYDAFFKYQTKPPLSTIGDVYYENKEFENVMKSFQPGRLSLKLRQALGISETAIPPFVANMQRYGPPPAYPNLKIPGVNVPLNDPTAEVTPNLWGLPDKEENNELVWDFKPNASTNHWGEIKDDQEDEVDDEEDMGNDEDDLELEEGEEDKPNVEGLFDNEEEIERNGNETKLLADKENNIEDYNEEEENSNEKFYKELPMQEDDMNEGELLPIGYKYQINQNQNNDMIAINAEQDKEDKKSINSEEYFQGDDEDEDNDDLGKKIF